MKNYICTAAGVIGAGIANIFGGWSAGMTTLIIFMAIDYITGLLVAGVFKASGDTTTVSGAVKNDLFLNISSWVVFKLMPTGIWMPQKTLAN